MNRSRSVIVASLLSILISPANTWGDCASCKWSDRGDRFEGVVTRQVSGGCCELLGVHYGSAGPTYGNADTLYLHFWMPREGKPEIVVWQPDLNYLMTPKDKRYNKGLQHFAWPRHEVLAPLGVNVASLYVRVSDGAKVHFPAQLSTSKTARSGGIYTFILESSGALDVKCTIEREESGRLVPVRSFPHTEDFGGVFRIEWDGHDDKGQGLPGGVYALRLKGQLESETIQRLNYTVMFQHYEQFQ